MTEEERLLEQFEFQEAMREINSNQSAKSTVDNQLRQEAKDMSFGDVTLISAGREFDKLGAGVMDIYDSIRSRMTDNESEKKYYEDKREKRRLEQEQKDQYYAPVEEENFGASLTGAMLPYMATLPAGLLASGVRGGAAAVARTTGKTIPKMLQKKVAKDVSHLAIKTGMGDTAKLVGRETAIGAAEGGAHYNDTALSGAAFGAGGALGGKFLGMHLAVI